MATSQNTPKYEKIQRPWTLLSSKAKVDEQIKQNKDALVVIFFNLNTPDRFSVETALKEKRLIYEDSFNTKFFKCVVIDTDDQIAIDFNVTKTPTFFFYRGDKEPKTLVKPSAEELFKELDIWSKQEPQQQ